MPSKARKAFDKNFTDIDRLKELREQEGGTNRGRRHNLEVLNKSAIVLVTAFWEAYCEDIASEGLQHILDHSEKADQLPIGLRKQLAREVKQANNDLEVWQLAGDGWKAYLAARMDKLKDERNRRLNTPKSNQIDELFKNSLGIERISDDWSLSTKMKSDGARNRLDEFVTLRGSIAHRGKDAESVTKKMVTDYAELVKKLAAKTGRSVSAHVRKATGSKLF